MAFANGHLKLEQLFRRTKLYHMVHVPMGTFFVPKIQCCTKKSWNNPREQMTDEDITCSTKMVPLL